MKSSLILVLALAGLMPFVTRAGAKEHDTSIKMDLDPPARWADRYDLDDARFKITTENGKVVLLLTDRVVAMQLSDRVLRKIDRKAKDAKDKEDGALGRAIKSAVLSGVRSLLNNSAECDIRDIARTGYEDGELILVSRHGKQIFDNVEVDDETVMRAFRESDARAFVRELRRRMGRKIY